MRIAFTLRSPAATLGCALCLGLALLGCGSTAPTDFPNRLVDSEGRTILLDDLEDIANDEDLSEEEKRQAFRDIGIEDEELVDALLGL